MDKRNKHVLINLTQQQYDTLLFIADSDNRKVSDEAYLLLLETLNQKILNYVSIDNGSFKKLKYNNWDE